MEKKSCLTSEAGNQGWVGRRVGACPKADCTTDDQWAKAFIDKGRGLRSETAVLSDNHLEVGPGWSD